MHPDTPAGVEEALAYFAREDFHERWCKDAPDDVREAWDD